MEPANFHERPATPFGIYQDLLKLSPLPRLIAGIVTIPTGILTTMLLWNSGFIWGLPLFFSAGGVFLGISGITGLRAQKARRERLAVLQTRREELLDAMVTERREGRNPVRWLNDQGIHDGEIRNLLLEGMNERFKRPSGK